MSTGIIILLICASPFLFAFACALLGILYELLRAIFTSKEQKLLELQIQLQKAENKKSKK